MVHGPVREVVRGPSPLDWSTDRGSVFSGHPPLNAVDCMVTHVHLLALHHPSQYSSGPCISHCKAWTKKTVYRKTFSSLARMMLTKFSNLQSVLTRL